MPTMTFASKSHHLSYLQQALDVARKSPPKSTNFCVGALLVSWPIEDNTTPKVLTTGYTLELPGNTHAEQCAFSKLASLHSIPESQLKSVLTPEMNVALYVTLEPCSKRLSGDIACVQRILATRDSGSGGRGGIRKVIFGAKEPGTYVKDSESCRMMTDACMEWEYVDGLQDEIIDVARGGYAKHGTNMAAITEFERRTHEVTRRNPRNHMIELFPVG
jgi:pyrimidine deaminase RibD-like protein